jgi:hypothetical protein
MEPDGSLLCLQESSIDSYFCAVTSSPDSLKIGFNIILSHTTTSS